MPAVRLCRVPDTKGDGANGLPDLLVPWLRPEFLHHSNPPGPNCVSAVRMRPLPNTSNDSLSDSTRHHPNPYYSSSHHRSH